MVEVGHVILLQNNDLGQCGADAERTVHAVNKVLAVMTRTAAAATQREQHVEYLHLSHRQTVSENPVFGSDIVRL